MKDHPDVQATFRGEELKRRAMRRERLAQEAISLAKRLHNEGILSDEILNKEDLEAQKTAVNRIQEQQLAFEKEMIVGYWKRLWYAIQGK